MSPAIPQGHSLKAVLFDLDGTLLSTLEDMLEALNDLLASLNHAPFDAKQMMSLITQGSLAMVRTALGDCSEEELTKHQHYFLEAYHKLLPKHTQLYPGIEELLSHLEQHGIAWGIVTNRIEKFTHPLLSKLGLKERAKVIVCADTYHVAKPHPLPITEAIKALGCKQDECIYVGDALTDIEAGQRAGIRAYIAAYGYCPDTPPMNAWGATGIFQRPESILPTLILEGLIPEATVEC